MTALIDLVDRVREDDDLFGTEGACPTLIETGGNPRVLLVTGGNAGGKSLVCRYLDLASQDAEPALGFMRIGMGLRTETGIHRAFMFGEEDRESTGRISGATVTGAVANCLRLATPHVLCLDEPDVGLSEDMQHGLGAYLAEVGADLPALTRGLVVVTHSRPVARALLALDPWCIRVGDDLRPTREWAASPPRALTSADFLRLGDVAHSRLRAVQSVIDDRRPGPTPGR